MTGAITRRTGTGGTGDRTLGWSSSDVEGLSFVIVSRSGEDEDDRREKRRQQAEARRLDQEHRGEARRGAGAGNMIQHHSISPLWTFSVLNSSLTFQIVLSFLAITNPNVTVK